MIRGPAEEKGNSSNERQWPSSVGPEGSSRAPGERTVRALLNRTSVAALALRFVGSVDRITCSVFQKFVWNGKPAGFPYLHKELHATARYRSIRSLSLDWGCGWADTCAGLFHVLQSRVCVLDPCRSHRVDASCGRTIGDLHSFRHSSFLRRGCLPGRPAAGISSGKIFKRAPRCRTTHSGRPCGGAAYA